MISRTLPTQALAVVSSHAVGPTGLVDVHENQRRLAGLALISCRESTRRKLPGRLLVSDPQNSGFFNFLGLALPF